MKNLIKVLAIIILMVSNVTTWAQQRTEKITVSGNCGMCEKKIEAAAKAGGAKKAEWDKNTKVLTVTYNASKTNNEAIQKKVASVGYDTEKFTADMATYDNLHECCKYDNKRAPEAVK
jgi:mercuric ion binding protein